jgi:hypothetical protein
MVGYFSNKILTSAGPEFGMGWVGFGSAAGKKEWVGYYRLVTLTARWNDFTYDSCTSGVGRGEVLVDPNGVDGAAER